METSNNMIIFFNYRDIERVLCFMILEGDRLILRERSLDRERDKDRDLDLDIE
jgi:hypothetical protein